MFRTCDHSGFRTSRLFPLTLAWIGSRRPGRAGGQSGGVHLPQGPRADEGSKKNAAAERRSWGGLENAEECANVDMSLYQPLFCWLRMQGEFLDLYYLNTLFLLFSLMLRKKNRVVSPWSCASFRGGGRLYSQLLGGLEGGGEPPLTYAVGSHKLGAKMCHMGRSSGSQAQLIGDERRPRDHASPESTGPSLRATSANVEVRIGERGRCR